MGLDVDRPSRWLIRGGDALERPGALVLQSSAEAWEQGFAVSQDYRHVCKCHVILCAWTHHHCATTWGTQKNLTRKQLSGCSTCVFSGTVLGRPIRLTTHICTSCLPLSHHPSSRAALLFPGCSDLIHIGFLAEPLKAWTIISFELPHAVWWPFPHWAGARPFGYFLQPPKWVLLQVDDLISGSWNAAVSGQRILLRSTYMIILQTIAVIRREIFWGWFSQARKIRGFYL